MHPTFNNEVVIWTYLWDKLCLRACLHKTYIKFRHGIGLLLYKNNNIKAFDKLSTYFKHFYLPVLMFRNLLYFI